MNYITNKASLAKNFHIQPSELEQMPMWEYELFIKAINDQIKDENDNQQKEMDKYNLGDYKKMANTSNFRNISNSKMPQMPKLPKL